MSTPTSSTAHTPQSSGGSVVASVIGAYYYLRIIKTMFFDEPVGAWANAEAQPVESGLIALSALFVSPVGYLAIPLLGAWSLTAARALF